MLWVLLLSGCQGKLADEQAASLDEEVQVEAEPQAGRPIHCNRQLTAEVVALDQVYTYNRFGAFNPVGMVYALRRDVVPIDSRFPVGPGNARLRSDKRPRPLTLRANVGDCLRIRFTNWLAPARAAIPDPEESQPGVARAERPGDDNKDDSPFTRHASVHVQGLQYLSIRDDGAFVGRNPSSLVPPGGSATYDLHADREGTFLFHSMGASFGGEGDGGSLALGLFGAINVEPPGARWYRSSVTAEVLQQATRKDGRGRPLSNPDGTPLIDYEARDSRGEPLLAILDSRTLELKHGDLDAIITGYRRTEVGTPTSIDQGHFREFTVLFHDELKAVQAFEELETNPTLESVADAFGVNYGSAGLGAELLANRARIGPTADCVECLYEDFFLESWANGDPALNVEKDSRGRAVRALYPDDPSNVHHSYLNDPVRFRNLHAGPKETHVFHLHAHQWRLSPGEPNSNYVDAQTIGPGASFTYDINFGGSGNRNLTPGDSIFHCHLYPHFAAGMWELWRVHDVFEAGTADRNLPDGEIAQGTPNPGLVPIPERPMPPLPTYEDTWVRDEWGRRVRRPAFPGYPFYIAARAGHRPSQPPLDMEEDGGLPRHIVTRAVGEVNYGAPGKRFLVEPEALDLKLLPQNGTPLERGAMGFHAGSFPGGAPATSLYGDPVAAYPAFTPLGRPGRFLVNGRPAQPGAPYADPCPPRTPERRYRAAYLQIDLQRINRAGWHDPQARITVLEQDVADTLSGRRLAEPFFVRAEVGECIVFSATNLVPKALEADDFQIYTPTDTLGQHIHLVKFDVTSADGAGNGFNYEDGTFSFQEVLERIELANEAGGAQAVDGTVQPRPGGPRVTLAPRVHPRLGVLGAQTTVQRWWMDPLPGSLTDYAAFTHDHFGPSSHQQHGLYGAVLAEPPGSRWRDPSTGVFFGTRADGGPTSFKADILTRGQVDSFREFSLFIADFTLAYDECGDPVNPPRAEEAPLPIAVLPPDRPTPEAVSASDPGTMVVNYRNEPIPLRISKRLGCGGRWQHLGPKGDVANVFRSDLHGDPYTPVLRGYPGDRVRMRVLQGAHEEQHSFSVHNHEWLREPRDPDSGLLNAQPVGISEQFVLDLVDGLPQVGSVYDVADALYLSASTTDLWNGMWGILRTHRRRMDGQRSLADVAMSVADSSPLLPYDPVRLLELPRASRMGELRPGDWPLQPSYEVDDRGDPLAQRTVEYRLENEQAVRRAAPELVERLEREGWFGMHPVATDSCPRGSPVRTYRVSAIDASQLPGGRLVYNEQFKIFDPDALLFVRDEHLEDVRNGRRKPEPLFLRARAGECVQVTLSNRIRPRLFNQPHWSFHPPITPYFNVNQVRPSPQVSLHPQLVGYDVNMDDGANVGLNAPQTVPPHGRRVYRWFAGELRAPRQDELPQRGNTTPVEYGLINLRNMADVVNHGVHGSVGALIIEPPGAVWQTDPGTEAQARVRHVTPDGRVETFREFVVLLQDELGLRSNDPRFQSRELNSGNALRNRSGTEDDAEDSGQKAFNYGTEPLWARLGLPPQTAPEMFNDKELSDILSSSRYGDPATPLFRARAGERMRIRLGEPSGHARQHAFALHGAEWQFNPFALGTGSTRIGPNPNSFTIATRGGFSVQQHENIVPYYGAGGRNAARGDYLYRDMASFQWSSGLWGIVRVE